MDICNVEGTFHNPVKSFKSNRKGNVSQREKDIRNNACFTSHKVGCRPWKHNIKDIKTTNTQVYAYSNTFCNGL